LALYRLAGDNVSLFALVPAIAVYRWPRLLPYMLIFHFLIDVQAAAMVLPGSLP
jgi:hypothetical protein